MLENPCASVGQTIPHACQDWASITAAYRFLSDGRVGERDTLSGYFNATAASFPVDSDRTGRNFSASPAATRYVRYGGYSSRHVD
jgi:hypothetical protein